MISALFSLQSCLTKHSQNDNIKDNVHGSKTNSIGIQTESKRQSKCQEIQIKELLDLLENKSQIKKLQEETKFYYGEKILLMENIQIEYKNYAQFPFNKDQQDLLRQTICAFLNTLGGRIYIGITDKNNSVNGLKLTQKQRDELRLQIDQLVDNQFLVPLVKPQEVKTVFIPIYNRVTNAPIPGKYVIKIIVRKGQTNKLYFLSNHANNSCYIRRDGKNQFLKPNEFCELIIERQSLVLTAEQQDFINCAFKDPEPEQIFEIFDQEEEVANCKKNMISKNEEKKKQVIQASQIMKDQFPLLKQNAVLQNQLKGNNLTNHFDIYFAKLKYLTKFHPTQIISQFCNKQQYKFCFTESENSNIFLEINLTPTDVQYFQAEGFTKKQQKMEASIQAINYFSSHYEFQQFFKTFLEKNHWLRYVNK